MSLTYGIISISHGRPNVLRLFCASMKRLRSDLGVFIPVVIVGDADHKPICDEYHIEHITQVNHPASEKWNRGMEYMKSIGVSYVTVLGSDDIISTPLMLNLISAMEKGYDLIGVSSVYFYGGNGRYRGMLRKLKIQHGSSGVARTISMRIIEQNHPLWRKKKSWGMDGDCLRTIWRQIKTHTCVDGDVFDVKTDDVVQLNKMSFWISKLHTNYPPEIFYSTLGEEEKQLLKKL